MQPSQRCPSVGWVGGQLCRQFSLGCKDTHTQTHRRLNPGIAPPEAFRKTGTAAGHRTGQTLILAKSCKMDLHPIDKSQKTATSADGVGGGWISLGKKRPAEGGETACRRAASLGVGSAEGPSPFWSHLLPPNNKGYSPSARRVPTLGLQDGGKKTRTITAAQSRINWAARDQKPEAG